jgi:radical SAM superfamily enzyme YgiQ (UPF0313 family)
MVKICFIYYHIYSYGTRSLVAYLKKHTNAEIKLLLIPTSHGRKFSETIVREVVKECFGFDLVGFSVLTNWYICTNQLAQELKKVFGVKIIYGGIHPTTCPEDCLNYADAVCLGESEEALAELVNRYEKGASLPTI